MRSCSRGTVLEGERARNCGRASVAKATVCRIESLEEAGDDDVSRLRRCSCAKCTSGWSVDEKEDVGPERQAKTLYFKVSLL